MSTWSDFLSRWRRAREEARDARDAQRDAQAAEELERGKINRFPPTSAGG